MRPGRRDTATIAVVALAALSGCSSGLAAKPEVAPFAAHPLALVAPPLPSLPHEKPDPRFTPVAIGPLGVAVERQSTVTATGATVTVYRFRAGVTHVALHLGSQDPPANLTFLPTAVGPQVTPGERRQFLAAFNGGFKMAAGVGGVMVAGTVVQPLLSGAASLVLYTDGTIGLGRWGSTVPAPHKRVASVRQNLSMLIEGGTISPTAASWSAWGATLGGISNPARSAVGLDGAGNLYYAASMAAVPMDLAGALQKAGATQAMQMDINPYWIQLAYAAAPGGPPSTGIPGQNREAGQYFAGWTRDFFVVTSAPGLHCIPSLVNAAGAIDVVHSTCVTP